MRMDSRHRLPAFVTVGLLAGVMGAQSALIHYYRFDEPGGGVLADEIVVNSQPGTFLSGMDPVNSRIPSGVPLAFGGVDAGNALLFEGVQGDGNFDYPPGGPFTEDREPQGPENNAVSFGSDPSFNLANEGTIMFWFRQDAGPTGTNLTAGALTNPRNANWIVAKIGAINPYIVHHQPSQGLDLRFEAPVPPDNNSAYVVVTPDPIPTNTWTHLAVSWSTTIGGYGLGDIDIYTNGVVAATLLIDVMLGLNEGASTLILGGDPANTGTGRGCACAVDELKVFDTYLDEAGVQAEMTVNPPAPQQTVPFNEVAQTGISMSLDTENGVPYALESATDLNADNWTRIGHTITGNGDIMAFFDPAGTPSTSYRFIYNAQ